MILTYRNNLIMLGDHLFWDVNIEKMGPIKNKRLIIERVVTRGNLDEFFALHHFYTEKTIKDTIVKIGTLDDKTLNFLSQLYNIKKSDFKCTKKRLRKKHWNS